MTAAISSEMRQRAGLAVKMAGTVYGEDLDLSEESVNCVERILDSLGRDRELTDDDRGRAAWAFGSYLGEVVRKGFPQARWRRHHPTYGQAGPYLTIGDIQLFPLVWCYKRLHGGQAESVVLKYRAFRQAHAARVSTAKRKATREGVIPSRKTGKSRRGSQRKRR